MPRGEVLRVITGEFESDVIAVSTGQVILPVDKLRPHSFAGVEFYSGADGATPVKPTAGSITYSAEVSVNPGVFEEITDGVRQANDPKSVNFSGNVTRVRVAVASVAGAAYFRLRVSQNYG